MAPDQDSHTNTRSLITPMHTLTNTLITLILLPMSTQHSNQVLRMNMSNSTATNKKILIKFVAKLMRPLPN